MARKDGSPVSLPYPSALPALDALLAADLATRGFRQLAIPDEGMSCLFRAVSQFCFDNPEGAADLRRKLARAVLSTADEAAPMLLASLNASAGCSAASLAAYASRFDDDAWPVMASAVDARVLAEALGCGLEIFVSLPPFAAVSYELRLREPASPALTRTAGASPAVIRLLLCDGQYWHLLAPCT